MVMNSDGSVGDFLNLPNSSSKGKSGRVVPLNKDLKKNLEMMLDEHQTLNDFDPQTSFIVTTERSKSTSPQSIVNMFQRWYGVRFGGMFVLQWQKNIYYRNIKEDINRWWVFERYPTDGWTFISTNHTEIHRKR